MESGNYDLPANGHLVGITAQCPAGKQVVGGVARMVSGNPWSMFINESEPSSFASNGIMDTWRVTVSSTNGGLQPVRVKAICVSIK